MAASSDIPRRSPWRESGAALAEAKRDATILALK
jgi:hypothetical protein